MAMKCQFSCKSKGEMVGWFGGNNQKREFQHQELGLSIRIEWIFFWLVLKRGGTVSLTILTIYLFGVMVIYSHRWILFGGTSLEPFFDDVDVCVYLLEITMPNHQDSH
jgi:hypothetical protein